jgi:hypothetical protein
VKHTKKSGEHTPDHTLSALWQRIKRGYTIASSAATLGAVAVTAIVASLGFAGTVHAGGSEDVVPGDNPICTMSTSGSFSFNTLLTDTLTVNLTGNCTRYPVLWEWTGKPLAYGLRNMAGDNIWFAPLLASGVMTWTYDNRKVTTVNTIPLVFNRTGTFTFAVRAKDAEYIPPNNQPAGFWGPWGAAGTMIGDTNGGYQDITLSCYPQSQTRAAGTGGALTCSGGQVSSITETRTFCADSVTPGWGAWTPTVGCACPVGTTWNGAACVPVPTCSVTPSPSSLAPGQTANWAVSCNTPATAVTWTTSTPPPAGVPVCTTGNSCAQTYPTPGSFCYAVSGTNISGAGPTSASSCVTVACPAGQVWSAALRSCGIPATITPPTFVVGLPAPTTIPMTTTGTPAISCTGFNLPAGWTIGMVGTNCTLTPTVPNAIVPLVPAGCTVTATNAYGFDTRACVQTLGVPLPACTVSANPTSSTPGQAVAWTTNCNTPPSSIIWRVTGVPPATLCTTGATCTQTYPSPSTVCYAVTGSNVIGSGPESAPACAVVSCPSGQTWSATANACGVAPTITAPTFNVGLPRPATLPVTVTGTPTLTCTAFNLPAGWSMSAACVLTPNNPGFTETSMPVGCTVTVTNPWGSDTRACRENITPQTACAVNWTASPTVLNPIRQSYAVQALSALINPDLGPVISPPSFGPLSRLSGNGGSGVLAIEATKADVIESVVCNGSDPITPTQPSTATGLSFNTVNFFDLLALPEYNGQVVVASATGQYNVRDTESYTETFVSVLLNAPAQIGRTAPSESSCTVTVRNSTTGNRATCMTPAPLEVVKLGERDTCSLTPESNTNGMSVWQLDTRNGVQASIPGAGNFSGTVETIKQTETLYTLLSLRGTGAITSPKTMSCVKRHRTAANPNAARSSPFAVDISRALFQSPPVYVTAQEDLVFGTSNGTTVAGWVNPRSTFTQVINPSEDDFDLDCRYVGTVNNTLTGQPANVSCSAYYSYRTGAACSFAPGGVNTFSQDFTTTGYGGGGVGTTYQGNRARIDGAFNYVGDTMTASWASSRNNQGASDFSYDGTVLAQYVPAGTLFTVPQPFTVPITPSRTMTPTRSFSANDTGYGANAVANVRFDLQVRREVFGRDSVGSCFVQAGSTASISGGVPCATCTGGVSGSTSVSSTVGGTFGNTNGTGGTTGGSSSTVTGQTGNPPPNPNPR